MCRCVSMRMNKKHSSSPTDFHFTSLPRSLADTWTPDSSTRRKNTTLEIGKWHNPREHCLELANSRRGRRESDRRCFRCVSLSARGGIYLSRSFSMWIQYAAYQTTVHYELFVQEFLFSFYSGRKSTRNNIILTQ